MKHSSLLTKSLSQLGLAAALLALKANTALAAINNPVIGQDLGGNPEAAQTGVTFSMYFVLIWRAFISVGAIAVLIFFIWGAFEWLTAGSEPNKANNGRQRIMNAIIGLIILVSSFTILGFVSDLLFGESFDLLRLTFPTPGDLTP